VLESEQRQLHALLLRANEHAASVETASYQVCVLLRVLRAGRSDHVVMRGEVCSHMSGGALARTAGSGCTVAVPGAGEMRRG